MAQLRQGAHSPEFDRREDLMAHYAGVQARIFAGPHARREPAAPPPPFAQSVEDRPVAPPPVLWTKPPTFAQIARAIVAEVAAAHGMPVMGIVGDSRTPASIAARWDAIVAIYKACPDVSLNRIARQFGRDRSCVLHALRQRGVYIARDGRDGRCKR